MFLHCLQMWAARDECDVFAGARQHRAKKGSDCACTDDREFHKTKIIEFRAGTWLAGQVPLLNELFLSFGDRRRDIPPLNLARRGSWN